MSIKVKLPPLFLINSAYGDNTIQQLGKPSDTIDASLANYSSRNLKAKIVIPPKPDDLQILIVRKRDHENNSFHKILYLNRDLPESESGSVDLSDGTWEKHPDLIAKAPLGASRVSEVVDSWKGGFSFISEDDENQVRGLREPQLGALHAIHMHWATTSSTATVVMPTGTGKTETMISALVSSQRPRVLILVPTDALRTQIAEKFLSFGVLKTLGVIHPSCLYPLVGSLKNRPTSLQEVDEFFTNCNVILSTPNVVGQIDESLQARIAHHCSTLFIDEAHHGGAETWRAIKSKFADKQILQFTATPYREDDKPIGDKIIFTYPLRRAQEKKYFSRINFKPVRVYARKKRDRAIAALAVRQLREDLKSYPHILMARVNTIARAKEVFSVYEQYGEFNPVQIHTNIKAKKTRDLIKRKLLTGESKIVVCVDMLGEGFDLPELKIAAFHDIKKSPTVTIQLSEHLGRMVSYTGRMDLTSNL